MSSGISSGAIALSWSGGKDSALTLWKLRREGREPAVLLSTVTEGYERISMHGVRRALLASQAERVGLPLVEVAIPPGCSNEVYEQQLERALARPSLRGIATLAFGDLFLEDVRAYREEKLATWGRHGLFPLWGRDTSGLAQEFINAGFEATLTCVDRSKLALCFAGRSFDKQFLADLPPDIDPCGEYGEFHTFVHAGPILTSPIAYAQGEIVERDGFAFCDLVPTAA